MPESEVSDLEVVTGYAKKHPGTVLVVAVAAYYVAAITVTSGYNPAIAVAIAREVDPATIGFATILRFTPTLLAMLVFVRLTGNGGLSRQTGKMLLSVTYGIFGLSVLASAVWWFVMGLIIATVTVFVVDRKHRRPDTPNVGADPHALRKFVSSSALVYFVMLPLIAGREVLPQESITLDSTSAAFTARVVSDSGDNLVLLISDPRSLIRVPGDRITDRQFCADPRSRSFAELIRVSESPRLDDCPDLERPAD